MREVLNSAPIRSHSQLQSVAKRRVFEIGIIETLLRCNFEVARRVTNVDITR
jgi:hypothetical protein